MPSFAKALHSQWAAAPVPVLRAAALEDQADVEQVRNAAAALAD